jgi:hypothetical protein
VLKHPGGEVVELGLLKSFKVFAPGGIAAAESCRQLFRCAAHPRTHFDRDLLNQRPAPRCHDALKSLQLTIVLLDHCRKHSMCFLVLDEQLDAIVDRLALRLLDDGVPEAPF